MPSEQRAQCNQPPLSVVALANLNPWVLHYLLGSGCVPGSMFEREDFASLLNESFLMAETTLGCGGVVIEER